MTAKRVYTDYLQDSLDSTERALEFVTDMAVEDSRRDIKTQFAVIRALEVIGEGTKQRPDALRDQYPAVP